MQCMLVALRISVTYAVCDVVALQSKERGCNYAYDFTQECLLSAGVKLA